MPKFKCSACGSSETVEVIYGMPPFELFEAEKRVNVVLGGCCFSEEDPN